MVEATPEVTMVDETAQQQLQQPETSAFEQAQPQPENSEMQEETKGEVPASVPVSTERICMFPNFDSKLCIATMLSYLVTWDQAQHFFACLNKRGLAYFEQHKPQFRYFIEDGKPVAPINMTFGQSCQYVRPLPFSRVSLLYLSNINADIHQIQEFARDTLAVNKLWIGDRDFKLFQDARIEEITGTYLPPSVQCRDSDRANLETIVNLVKKTQCLKLQTLPQTGILLKMISRAPMAFQNITGLHLHIDDDLEQIQRIPEDFMSHIRDLALLDSSFGMDPTQFVTTATALIKKTSCLVQLQLLPNGKKSEWLSMLAECAPKFRHLTQLTLTTDYPLESNTDQDVSLIEHLNATHYENYSQLTNVSRRAANPDEMDALTQFLEDPELRHNINAFKLMKPYQKTLLLATVIHKELAKMGDTLKNSMPELEKLVIARGFFSLQSTEFFPPLLTLEVNAQMHPDGRDKLPAEQLASIKNLTIDKSANDSDKALHVVRSLAEGATSLQTFSIDLHGLQPKRLLEMLYTDKTGLRSLKLLNVSTELVGLTLFNDLPNLRELKDLKLNFARLRDADITKTAKNCRFAAGAVPSVQNLIIEFSMAGKLTQLSSPLWVDFLCMFSDLKSLTISCAGGSEDETFWPKIFSAMPQLRTLKLSKGALKPKALQIMATALANPACQVQNLSIEYDPVDVKVSSRALPMKARSPASLEAIEQMLRQLTEQNRSLKSLEVVLAVRQSIALSPSLLQTLATHSELRHFSIMGVLKCMTQQQYDDLKALLTSTLQQLPKLKNFLVEPIGDNKSRMTDQEVQFKSQLVQALKDQLPSLEQIKL